MLAEKLDGYPLNKILEVMKPHKLDMEKFSHKTKMEEVFASPSYIAEPKIDGCHYVNVGGRFFSTQISKKTGVPVEKTAHLPHLVEGLMKMGSSPMVLDGEIYYPGWKSYNVTTITGCGEDEAIRRQERSDWLYYMVFDILRDPDGNWLFNRPWRERRELLERIAGELQEACSYFQVVPVIRSRKQQFLEKELAEGREGAVLKHVNGIYVMGKRPMWNWIKIKIDVEDDVVIMGFEPPVKRYSGTAYETWPYWEDGEPVSKHYAMGWIGSIIFGKYDAEGNLVELGRCTGIDEVQREEFSNYQDQYIGQVMKIKAMEKTEDGKFRHPNFVMLHPDKNPHECVL